MKPGAALRSRRYEAGRRIMKPALSEAGRRIMKLGALCYEARYEALHNTDMK
jgi:hypothetical protein